MRWAAILFVLCYAGLKGAQLAFAGSASGYRSRHVGLGRRLTAGGPTILMVVALFAVPPALIASWYHGHKFNAVMRHSLDCHGLIAVYRSTPEITRSNGESTVYLVYEGYQATALDAARQLGLAPAAAQRRLDKTAEAFEAERSRAAVPIRMDRIAETQHCLHLPGRPGNE